MKKILVLIIAIFCIFGNSVFAEETVSGDKENLVLQGEAVFNWLDMSQIERDTIIQNYKNIIFDENTVYKYKRKEIKELYSEHIKDKNVQEHYFEAQAGITETNEYKLSAFFHGKLLISYAIQYKNNPRTIYYYDALGHLKYIDMISENYPNFPYWSKQYKVSGKMISAIYFVSHDMQYMYEPDGEFQGVWFMDKRYDRNAKQDLTRTNW